MALLGGWRLTRTGVLFVVGILVLGGLVTGGIFLVKNHGEAVRRDEAVKIAEQNLKEQSEVATQPVVESEEGAEEEGVTRADVATNAANDAAKLPETGFDGLERILIVAILALSVAMYVSSRQASARL